MNIWQIEYVRKVAPDHTVKACSGSGGVTPNSFLTSELGGGCQPHAPAALPPLPIE